jgi:DNA-binding CsgD family transcriptional regulator
MSLTPKVKQVEILKQLEAGKSQAEISREV